MKREIVDLHTHSVYSDGCNTPEEILNMAISKGVTTLAITDHDFIEGSKELVRINQGRIDIYSGVELTIKSDTGRMHLLGYNIDLDNPQLNKVLLKQREDGIYNVLLYIEVLKKDFNLFIPNEEIDKMLSIKGNVGRPQLAILLVKLGYCKDVEEAFQKYLIYAYEKVRKIKKGITEEEGIELIKNANGVPILAHPNSLKKSYKELKEKIIYLKSVGLQGLETTHPNLNMEERYIYSEFAKELNLLESGGSDFHGIEVKPDVELGRGRNNNFYIPKNTLTLTKKIKSRY